MSNCRSLLKRLITSAGLTAVVLGASALGVSPADADTPPLRAAPTVIPLTAMRPSLLAPPFAEKKVIVGESAMPLSSTVSPAVAFSSPNQDLACSERCCFAGPFHYVEEGVLFSFTAGYHPAVTLFAAFCTDGKHHCRGTKFFRQAGEQLGLLHFRRIHHHTGRARTQQ